MRAYAPPCPPTLSPHTMPSLSVQCGLVFAIWWTCGERTLKHTTDHTNMMFHRHRPPSRVHTPSQEAPTALGQLTHLCGGSLAPSTVRPTVLYCHHHQLTPAGPYNTPPRRSCETLEPSSIGARQHPRVLPGSVTHRSLLCSMSCVCHNTMYTSQDRGVLAAKSCGFWLNCSGAVRAVHSYL